MRQIGGDDIGGVIQRIEPLRESGDKPASSQRGVISTNTMARNRPGQRASEIIPNSPPMEAPISTGGCTCSPATMIRSSANCWPS
jgi:hypothetical protein